jgi:hypothetical protein
LKKELLLDLNLNKEFVRNYELAARRLEGVFMQKLEPEKLKDFEKLLRDEVKEFLGLTTTGKKIQDLDYKITVNTNNLSDIKELIQTKFKEIDFTFENEKYEYNEKIKEIETKLEEM